jgi:hypothetical protein
MRRVLLAAAAAGVLISGCGSDDEGQEAAATAAPASVAAVKYEATSDVAAHAAIGDDVAAIREALGEVTDSDDAAFADARAVWAEGEHSKKDDGTMRTLAGFVESGQVGKRVGDALAGIGETAELSPAERREWVDNGMLVALRAKVLDELGAAAEKVEAGNVEPAEGAPHNVDEAWAFFVANGQGIEALASEADEAHGLEEGAAAAPAIAALSDAQAAATTGDGEALAEATDAVRGALNRIFALAVQQRAVAGDDAESRAATAALAWALEEDLPLPAREAIAAAVDGGTAAEAGEAVHAALAGASGDLGYAGELPDAPAPSP